MAKVAYLVKVVEAEAVEMGVHPVVAVNPKTVVNAETVVRVVNLETVVTAERVVRQVSVVTGARIVRATRAKTSSHLAHYLSLAELSQTISWGGRPSGARVV